MLCLRISLCEPVHRDAVPWGIFVETAASFCHTEPAAGVVAVVTEARVQVVAKHSDVVHAALDEVAFSEAVRALGQPLGVRLELGAHDGPELWGAEAEPGWVAADHIGLGRAVAIVRHLTGCGLNCQR